MNFDFSDYTYSGLIGIFSAIIGMCYPMMLQAIDGIDEKYHVVRFVELFKEEKVYFRFNILLLLSIAFAVIDPFALYLMNNILWMQVSVLVCHTLVILLLLLHVINLYRMILIYKDSHQFVKHLVKKPGVYVLELIDLSKYAAQNEDISLYNECTQYVSNFLSNEKI